MKKVGLLLLAFVLLLFAGCAQKRPVIYAPDARINPGEVYDADDGIHALDAVDGDVTSLVQVTRGKLNTEKKGRYRICYEVTNSRGYTARTSRIITVSEQTPAFWNTLIVVAVIVSAVLILCGIFWLARGRRARRGVRIAKC